MTSQPEPAEPEGWKLLEDLYYQGLTMNEDDRAALLEPYRERHPSIVAEVEDLWNYEPQHDHIFDSLPGISRDFWQGFGDEPLPERIGVYEVIEELGRGGMGVVYRAKQPPFDREVAIKVLPSALSSSAWRARFEREQQLLSAMNHIYIATVHDAGTTQKGQPYLVMELLEGMPIHAYCDHHQLSLQQRLNLFVKVCDGVNHAHRKGVIHRDLKASNVLVVNQDGQPLPKVIDFGIAGSPDLAESLKQKGALGTPAYMSPEQAGLDEAEVDTRSDIYALGAILFELLLGRTPLETELLAVKGFQERIRMVGEMSPKGLAIQAEQQVNEEVARKRRTTVAKLRRRLRGELDWITAKALSKEPDGRYDSCSELIADLERYKQNQPVLAAGKRTWYHFWKWLTAHRLMVGTGSSVAVAMVAALVLVTDANSRLENVHEFWKGLFKEVSPYSQGRDVLAVELLDDAAARVEHAYEGRPWEERDIQETLAQSYTDLGFYDKAEQQFSRLMLIDEELGTEGKARALKIRAERAHNLFLAEQYELAIKLYEEGIALASEHHGPNHHLSLLLQNGYATVLADRGDYDSALGIYKAVLAAQKRALGTTHREVRSTENNLAETFIKMGDYEAAKKLLEEVLAAYRLQATGSDPFFATLIHNLALAHSKLKETEQSMTLGKEALAARKHLLGIYHPETLVTANNLAIQMKRTGDLDQAIRFIESIFHGLPERAENGRETLRLRHTLGDFLLQAKQTKRAITVLEETYKKRLDLLKVHRDTLITQYTLGEAYFADGDPELGRTTMGAAIRTAETTWGQDHPLARMLKTDFNKRFAQVL